MDAQMPGLSGTRLIAQLRARSQAALYAISGSNPPPDVLAAADGFLLKPFTAGDLRKLFDARHAQPAPSPATPSPIRRAGRQCLKPWPSSAR